jgi:hypothetical protein
VAATDQPLDEFRDGYRVHRVGGLSGWRFQTITDEGGLS